LRSCQTSLPVRSIFDAKPSTFAEINAISCGSSVTRNEDGTAIQAERLISGTFRQIAATITSVNAQRG
jgi:hypothetical protein